MSAQHAPKRYTEGFHWCIRREEMRGKEWGRGGWFHFWDRDIYGEPQFGDPHGAKRYKTLAGATSRLRALRTVGERVHGVIVLTSRADTERDRAAIATTKQEPQ